MVSHVKHPRTFEPKDPMFTAQEVLAILKNMGHDVECGACMAVAFTGGRLPGDEHTCGKAPDRKWGVRTVHIGWAAVDGGRDAVGSRLEAEALAKRLTEEHLAEAHDPEQLVAYIAAPYSGWDPEK